MDEIIIHCLTKLGTETSKNVLKLKDKVIPEELKVLHNKFVVISSNVACVVKGIMVRI